MRASFLYCEPFRVEKSESQISGTFQAHTSDTTLLGQPEAPRWVATAQRYIEQTEVELQQDLPAEETAGSVEFARRTGVEDALREIRATVTDYFDTDQKSSGSDRP
jgi:hypothetical protein